MSKRRENNDGALQDYLDVAYPAGQPGSPDPDMLMDKTKSESRVPLKEAMLKRIERKSERESDELLHRLMVEPGCRLAREDPQAHSALSQFVLGAPHGYKALTLLEREAHRDPFSQASAVAPYLRRGYERVLDYLDNCDHWLSVPSIPRVEVRAERHADARRDDARAMFLRKSEASGDAASAIKDTARETGYSRSQIRRITEDLRDHAS